MEVEFNCLAVTWGVNQQTPPPSERRTNQPYERYGKRTQIACAACEFYPLLYALIDDDNNNFRVSNIRVSNRTLIYNV